MVDRGTCFLLRFTGEQIVVYVLEWDGPDLWITAAGGNTTRHTRAGLSVIEHQARTLGARKLKFQTVRPGLAKLAKRCGYQVDGIVWEKDLHGSASTQA